jgi:thioredoxin 1/putative thioredoxin
MPLPVVAEQDFEPEVLRSQLPVLVDFFADWCQPCKITSPEVEALGRELEGKLKVVKVDIDRSPRLAQLLRIQSVPTFMVFAGGRPVAAEQGTVRRDRLRAMVEPFLPRAEGAVSPRELAQLVAQRQVVPVDTRDAASFARAHLPRATHMPLGEVDSRLAELAMLGMPVLYCRTGSDTKLLAERLGRDGIPAAFLEGGLLAWEAENLPVERPD